MFLKKSTNKNIKQKVPQQPVGLVAAFKDNKINTKVNVKDSIDEFISSPLERGLAQRSNVLKEITSSKKDSTRDNPRMQIGTKVNVEGNIEDFKELDIDGQFKGVLKGGRCIISPLGKVEGELDLEHLDLHGYFEGQAVISGTATISATGFLKGSLICDSLEILCGGNLNGEVKTNESKKLELNLDKQRNLSSQPSINDKYKVINSHEYLEGDSSSKLKVQEFGGVNK